MNTECFSKMPDKKKKNLYEAMWKENIMFSRELSDRDIEKTINEKNNKPSDNSYSFVNGNTADGLFRIFDIPKDKQQLFSDKFKMACGGSGNESRKIATLHSSSLCALLFFYNVTEEHPLTIEGVGTFTESVFEFRSPVIDPRYPSCMDVVLIGKNDNKDIVLFLESKFAEYYLSASKKSAEISKKYLVNVFGSKIYNNRDFKKLGIEIEEKEDSFQLVTETNDPFYINGIKQMISHYIGVNNNLDGNFCRQKQPDYQDRVINAIKTDAKVILGEVLFDNNIGDFTSKNGKSFKDAYAEKYELLAKLMNECNDKERFEVLQNDLLYSMFKTSELKEYADKRVMEYYFG